MKDSGHIHDYENAVRKGYAYYVCPECGENITLELVMLAEMEEENDRQIPEDG